MGPDVKDRGKSVDDDADGVDDVPDATVVSLAKELASRWVPQLRNKSWNERLRLLQQIHEQLQEDLEDLDLYSEISPQLIREIIERLPQEPIASFEQAHIYSNSADRRHRRMAGEWLAGRAPRGS